MQLSDLIGKIFVAVQKIEDEIHFTDSTGKGYKLYHEPECCENVYIESIVGELSDLESVPIISAFESIGPLSREDCDGYVSQWTFYKFATIKGYVDIRFCGGTEGPYSIGVDFGGI